MNLIEAIKQNNQEEFFRLLNAKKIIPFGKRVVDEADGEWGGSPLYWAAACGHVHFIIPLIQAKADINKLSNAGETSVYIAAEMGHAIAITILSAAGANVHTPNKKGETPAYIAAKRGHSEAITALKAAGANVDTPNKRNETPVFIASKNGRSWHAKAISALRAAGANMNMPNNDGETPVYIAAKKGHAAIITALKTAGANMNAQGENAMTPVYIAATFNCAEAITALKAADANMDTPDEDGATPIFVAAYRGHEAAMFALLEAGADASIKTRWGVTALEQARQGTGLGHQEVVKLLEAHFQQYPNGIKPVKMVATFLEHDLQEIKKEEQVLDKEIIAQKSECASLSQQKAECQKQIIALEQSLAQKSGTDQRKMQANLEALQGQLLVIQAQHNILWDECRVKVQKHAVLKWFQSDPNLLLFYRTVHIKLEEIFISFKAVAGGEVKQAEDSLSTLGIAKSIFDLIGDVASIAPIVGAAVDKGLKWTVRKGLETLENTRRKNTAVNASALVTLSEVKKYAESIARQLTERYADQLQQLATLEEEQVATHKVNQGLTKAKEMALKESSVPAAKQLATFGVLWIMDELIDAKNIDTSKALDEALLSVFSQRKPSNKITACWQEITANLGINGVLSKNGSIWHPEAVYTLPGLKVGNKYYSAERLDPETYGWRLGTAEEVQALGLEQIQVSNAQPVEPGSIPQSAATEALRRRIEHIERVLPKKRPSGIKNFTKKDEKENMLDALEELRTFFLGQRDMGEESENIKTYEKYLKMANKEARLIYLQEDRKHILCIGPNVLDRGVAAQAIWNMIKGLEPQMQSTLPPARQPVRSINPSSANSSRVAPSASFEQKNSGVFNQFQPSPTTPAPQARSNQSNTTRQPKRETN